MTVLQMAPNPIVSTLSRHLGSDVRYRTTVNVLLSRIDRRSQFSIRSFCAGLRMIISVHLPKTAGTSFGMALESHFGTSFLKDYADFPINTPEFERNKAALQAALSNAEKDFTEVECIHGHFLPVKYLLMATKREVRFVTWMRNPVERIVSHYFFWRRAYDPETVPTLHRKVIEENWTLEQFCLSPLLKDLYGKFLWGFSIENFDFIGITEFYNEDFPYFSRRYLGVDLEIKRLNTGDRQGGEYRIDKTFRNQIEAFHERDMDLYRRACEIRLRKRVP